MKGTYSVKPVSETLVSEIKKALVKVDRYGSVELFIQNGVVTQITVRSITKTNGQDRMKEKGDFVGLSKSST